MRHPPAQRDTRQLNATARQLNATTRQLNATTRQLNATTRQLNETARQLNATLSQLKATEQQNSRFYTLLQTLPLQYYDILSIIIILINSLDLAWNFCFYFIST
jgi:septal ring factor EnvC (AmiA/AmiB activator)